MAKHDECFQKKNCDEIFEKKPTKWQVIAMAFLVLGGSGAVVGYGIYDSVEREKVNNNVKQCQAKVSEIETSIKMIPVVKAGIDTLLSRGK